MKLDGLLGLLGSTSSKSSETGLSDLVSGLLVEPIDRDVIGLESGELGLILEEFEIGLDEFLTVVCSTLVEQIVLPLRFISSTLGVMLAALNFTKKRTGLTFPASNT